MNRFIYIYFFLTQGLLYSQGLTGLINEKNKLVRLRRYIENNFNYVGKDFSKKVREVYYDKKNNKAIYGTTTPKEREELAEEGIELLSIPWVNKDN